MRPPIPPRLTPSAWWLALWASACTCAPEAPPAEGRPDKAKLAAGKGGDVPPELARVVAPTPVDADHAPVTPVAVPERPPHVLLVVWCTVRKDQLGVYGGPADTSPFLDELAAGGAVFDDPVASAPWTRAAATAILVGRDAVDVGMVEPGEGRNERVLRDDLVTLAERMQAAGYATIGNTANPNLDATYGFHQGFDRYQTELPPFPKSKLDSDTVVDALLTATQGARAEADGRPLYLQTVLIDPHGPRSYRDALPQLERDPRVPMPVHNYRQYVRRLDDGLRRLHTGLDALGLVDEGLLVVVIGDHGEGLLWPTAHGPAHGQYLSPSATHVAWVMHGPGVAQGQRVLGLAAQLDVVPTLLGTLGRGPVDLPGRDWSGLVRGDGHVTDRERVFVDTWFKASNRAAVYTRTRACLREFGSRVDPGDVPFVTGCFDRVADPLFLDAFGDPALMREVIDWRAGKVVEAGEAAEAEVGVKEALGELGYVE